jgi:hypothetical protein
MTRTEVEAVLLPLAFVQRDDDPLINNWGWAYFKAGTGQWTIGAHAHAEDGVILHVDLGLHLDPRGSTIGTVHRVESLPALHANATTIVEALEALAQDEDQLKCPKCGVRWVVLKEPSPAALTQFRPFLSCEGMHKVRSGKRGVILCNGVSRRIPPLVRYP